MSSIGRFACKHMTLEKSWQPALGAQQIWESQAAAHFYAAEPRSCRRRQQSRVFDCHGQELLAFKDSHAHESRRMERLNAGASIGTEVPPCRTNSAAVGCH